MKLRRFAAAAVVAASVVVAAPAANAQPAPEPLNMVLREITKVGGWEAQNIMLLPAGLSAVSFIASLITSFIR